MNPNKTSWGKRIRKFLDNPFVITSFLRARLWYPFIADTRSATYEHVCAFLDGPDTIKSITTKDRSLIRTGDGTFGYLEGASIYFNDWQFTYDQSFAKKLGQALTEGQGENILFCYPHRFILPSKREFEWQGIGSEWRFWVRAKATLRKYLRDGHTYGDSFCFHGHYNPNIDFAGLKRYLDTKHIIIVTSNTARFSGMRLGKSVSFVASPSSDAWHVYEDLESKMLAIVEKNAWQKHEVLFMISTAEAAKVMVFDLAKQGYTAWDTGQFFDLAAKEIAALG